MEAFIDYRSATDSHSRDSAVENIMDICRSNCVEEGQPLYLLPTERELHFGITKGLYPGERADVDGFLTEWVAERLSKLEGRELADIIQDAKLVEEINYWGYAYNQDLKNEIAKWMRKWMRGKKNCPRDLNVNVEESAPALNNLFGPGGTFRKPTLEGTLQRVERSEEEVEAFISDNAECIELCKRTGEYLVARLRENVGTGSVASLGVKERQLCRYQEQLKTLPAALKANLYAFLNDMQIYSSWMTVPAVKRE